MRTAAKTGKICPVWTISSGWSAMCMPLPLLSWRGNVWRLLRRSRRSSRSIWHLWKPRINSDRTTPPMRRPSPVSRRRPRHLGRLYLPSVLGKRPSPGCSRPCWAATSSPRSIGTSPRSKGKSSRPKEGASRASKHLQLVHFLLLPQSKLIRRLILLSVAASALG